MRASLALFALAAFVAAEPVPGGVSSAIAPKSSPPPGCSGDYKGSFQIAPVNVSSSSKRSLEERQSHNVLTIGLSGGILTDSTGRTGYVAANYQLQFDDPPQAGAMYTSGFSVCPNGRLAVGGDTTWEKCLSGPGSTNQGFFYNLYLKNDGGQCIKSYILAEPYGSGSGPIPVSGSSATTSAGSSTAPVTSTASSSSSTAAAGNSSSTIVSPTTTAQNGTVTMSSSSSGSMATTTGKHTGGGGGVTKQTTLTSTQAGPTNGGTKTGGTATQASASASSSTAAGPAATGAAATVAAATLGLRTEVFGLAAGLLAYAVL